MKRFLWAAALALLLTFAIARFSAWYAEAATPWLDAMGESVGEVLLHEGERLQAAGQVEAALEKYEHALTVRFEGDKNRRYTHYLLGAIFLERGDLAGARRHLVEALKGDTLAQRDPTLLQDARYKLEDLID